MMHSAGAGRNDAAGAGWRDAVPGRPAGRAWLTGEGSLTRRLQAACADFRVRRLCQGPGYPNSDEWAVLALAPRRLALVREVALLCGDEPLVFAHTVIPRAGLYGPWRHLTGLGDKPLGGALFADPRIRRGPLAFRCLDARHPLYRAASLFLGEPAPRLWARRSRFELAGAPLLVTEVFLPPVLRLPSP